MTEDTKNEDKISSRRKIIFSILDTMREAGEKISAQKLAARANMGKQTVLPLYRQWQEREYLTDAEQIDLSESLLRAIKHEVAREKFSCGEAVRAIEASFEAAKEDFAEKESAYMADKSQLQEIINGMTNEADQIKSRLDESETNEQQSLAQIAALEKKCEIQQIELNALHRQLADTEAGKEQALKLQKENMEASHEKILDYWMTVIDNERKEKSQLQQILEKEKKKCAEQYQTNGALENEVDRLKKAQSETGAEIIKYEAQQEKANKHLADLTEIADMFNNPDNLPALLLELKNNSERYNKIEAEQVRLNDSLASAEEKIQLQSGQLEKALPYKQEAVRLQAYINGLKQQDINTDTVDES